MPGGRSPSAPNGSVSDEEIVDVWCYAESEGHLDEEVPYWLLKRVALVDGIISREDLIERESDYGTYEGFPNAETYNKAIEAIEQRGADPSRDPVDTSTTGETADPISTLPLGALNAMDPDEARQFAQRRGHDWPTTDEARSQLRDRILSVVRAGQKIVLDAPTSLGKSHTTATIPWLNHADNTGESPVVHLHPTKDARDEAAVASSNAGAVSYAKLLGRDEACSCAAGDHDPSDDDDDDEEPDQVVTIDGLPASQWIQQMCEG